MVQDFQPSIREPVGQTPLRRFRGVLAEFKPEEREYESRKYMVITFNFTDVEVIESVEPYPFPIASLTVPYSPPEKSRGGTRWEALSRSLRKFGLDPSLGLKPYVGKRQEWALNRVTLRGQLKDEEGNPIMVDDPRNPGQQRAQWGDVEDDAWQVEEVEGLDSGAGAAQAESMYDLLAGMADGKTDKQFYEVALQDQRVIRDAQVVTAITDRQLIGLLETMGKLTKDEQGVLHRVAGA